MTSDPDRPLPPFPDEGRPAPAPRMARETRVDHLAAVPLFADCSRRQLRHVAAQTRLLQLDVDEAIVTEGESSREAYMIVAGSAIVRRDGRAIAELGPGAFVGELGLLLQRSHSATVVTTTPVEVLALDQRSLRTAIEEVPGLGWKLLQTVARRVADGVATRNVEVAGPPR